MQIRLNAWRGDHGPGDIIDVAEEEAAALLHHGAAHPADDIDVELDKATKAARSATLAAAKPDAGAQ